MTTITSDDDMEAPASASKPRVGAGWAVAIFLFGLLAGFAGWLTHKNYDRPRANRILLASVIWSAIMFVVVPVSSVIVLGIMASHSKVAVTGPFPTIESPNPTLEPPANSAGLADNSGSFSTDARPECTPYSGNEPSLADGHLRLVLNSAIVHRNLTCMQTIDADNPAADLARLARPMPGYATGDPQTVEMSNLPAQPASGFRVNVHVSDYNTKQPLLDISYTWVEAADGHWMFKDLVLSFQS